MTYYVVNFNNKKLNEILGTYQNILLTIKEDTDEYGQLLAKSSHVKF